jgi:hypothetical protein
MGKFGTFLLGVVVGGAAVLGALKYHVVYATDGVHFVPKLFGDFDDIYVDIRDFDLSDWNEHKSLAAALIKAEKGHLVEESAANQLRESLDRLLDRFGDTLQEPEN